VAWWDNLKINALPIAKGLWEESRTKANPIATPAPQQQVPTDPPEAALRYDPSKFPNEAN
jgi:hypothetical protein